MDSNSQIRRENSSLSLSLSLFNLFHPLGFLFSHKIHHHSFLDRNLLNFYGYGAEFANLFIVKEFMEKGSLYDVLYKKKEILPCTETSIVDCTRCLEGDGIPSHARIHSLRFEISECLVDTTL